MANDLEARYKIFKDGDGEFNVWKIDEQGNKVAKKNKTPYESNAAALPYLRKLYSVMPESEKANASEEDMPDTNPVTASTELVLGSVHFEADMDNPRFLRFHDAVLARAETNANRDELDDTGISELAATISGTPIDVEHDPKKNIGFFTSGKADNGVLRVDGVVWTDRCAAYGVDPNEIENLTYRTSIEATAGIAECSICRAVYEKEKAYCEHIKDAASRAIHGAKRLLRGLRAAGGAITKKPAGTGTTFSPNLIYFIASHQGSERGIGVDDDTRMNLLIAQICDQYKI